MTTRLPSPRRTGLLGSAGLIDQDATGRWGIEARGIDFEIPAEPEAQRAARDLSNTTLLKYSPVPSAWVPKSSHCSR